MSDARRKSMTAKYPSMSSGVTKKRASRSKKSITPDPDEPFKPKEPWQQHQDKDNDVNPSYHGWVKGTLDALVLVEMALTGQIPHVARRPHEEERNKIIKSGSVFVYEKESSGINRWTDTLDWSPSRIHGNFLMYRQLEKPLEGQDKKKAISNDRKPTHSTLRTRDELKKSFKSLGINFHEFAHYSDDQLAKHERDICGSLIESYGFMEGGLLKKTISVKYKGLVHHVVSYYNASDVMQNNLRRPIEDFRTIPRVEVLMEQEFRAAIEEEDIYRLTDEYGRPFAQTQAFQHWMVVSSRFDKSRSGSWAAGPSNYGPSPHQMPGQIVGFPPTPMPQLGGQLGMMSPAMMHTRVFGDMSIPNMPPNPMFNQQMQMPPTRHHSEQMMPTHVMAPAQFPGHGRPHAASMSVPAHSPQRPQYQQVFHGQNFGHHFQSVFPQPEANGLPQMQLQGPPQPQTHTMPHMGAHPVMHNSVSLNPGFNLDPEMFPRIKTEPQSEVPESQLQQVEPQQQEFEQQHQQLEPQLKLEPQSQPQPQPQPLEQPQQQQHAFESQPQAAEAQMEDSQNVFDFSFLDHPEINEEISSMLEAEQGAGLHDIQPLPQQSQQLPPAPAPQAAPQQHFEIPDDFMAVDQGSFMDQLSSMGNLKNHLDEGMDVCSV